MGQTVSFYTDDETKQQLDELAELEKRSVSNYLTLLINWAFTDKKRQLLLRVGDCEEEPIKITE